MKKNPGLNESEICETLHENGGSPRPQNSPFTSPDRDNCVEIEDENSPDIFETQVKSTGTYTRSSALQTTFGQMGKSIVSPRGSSNLSVGLRNSDLSNDSFFDNNRSKPSLSLKSNTFSSLMADRDPLDIFKSKSNFKPISFLYETSDKNQRSGFSTDENQALDKAGVEFTKTYDKWVRKYLSITKDIPNSAKLPVIETSHLNEFFERTKISNQSCNSRTNQKKHLKGNTNTQINNSKRNKNQNQNIEERGGSIPQTESGWTPRCKERYEKVVKNKSLESSNHPVEAEEGEKNPYSFSEEENNAENAMAETSYKGSSLKEKIGAKHNASSSESSKREANIDVQFDFSERIMKESPVTKPNQPFKNALLHGQERGSNSEMCQKEKPVIPFLNQEDRLKSKDNVKSIDSSSRGGRGRGGSGRGRQDALMGAITRNGSDTSRVPVKNERSNQQFSDVIKIEIEDEKEENMLCPICNQTFKMGDQLQAHVNSCLDEAPRQTRSREQAHGPGKKRHLDPEGVYVCPHRNLCQDRNFQKEHLRECARDKADIIYSRSDSDEDSSSLAPSSKIQRRH